MQTIPYSQQISLQKLMKSCLEDLSPQNNDQHFQHYLRQQFYACLPHSLQNGVAPDQFQAQTKQSKQKALWTIYAKNSLLAHQFHFLAMEMEKRIVRRVFSDISGQSALPERVRQFLKQLPRFRFQVVVRGDYFEEERERLNVPLNPLVFKAKHFNEQQASEYLQAFWAKRFDAEGADKA